jgi:hypothetical protein
VWYVGSVKNPEAALAGLPGYTDDLRDPDDVANAVGMLENYPQELIEHLLTGAPLPDLDEHGRLTPEAAERQRRALEQMNRELQSGADVD